MTIGSGIGLLSLSVIVADFVLLNFTEKKKLFKKIKEQSIKKHHLDGVMKNLVFQNINNDCLKSVTDRKTNST